MKNLSIYIATIILAIGATLITQHFTAPQNNATAVSSQEKESAYDRVMRTGTIRCGYALWEPGFIADPNTEEITGLIPEIMNTFSKYADIKVEWTTEVDWSRVPQELEQNKVDVMCAGMWPDGRRGKYIIHSKPLMVMAARVFMRAGEAAQYSSYESLNKPDMTFAVVEGDILQKIVDINFPKANQLDLLGIANAAENLTSVAAGKADATININSVVQGFSRSNPGQLEAVDLPPISYHPIVLATYNSEDKLINFINATLTHMHYAGEFKRILKKYQNQYPGSFYSPLIPINFMEN